MVAISHLPRISLRYLLEPDLWLLEAGTGELTNLTDDGVEGGFINSGQESGRESLSLDIYPRMVQRQQTAVLLYGLSLLNPAKKK